jgi:hypothetical protein
VAAAAWSTGGDSPGTTEAIVLSDPAELAGFTRRRGIATISRDGPLLVTAGQPEGFLGDRSPAANLLAHEVAHELIRHRIPAAPRWFHEGLAGYLETIFAIDDRQVRFGILRAESAVLAADEPRGADADRCDRERRFRGTSSRSRETVSPGDGREAPPPGELNELYLSARLWVGVLRTQEPMRMQALEAALAGGASWRRAWANLRSGLDVARLQEKVFWEHPANR